MCMSEADRIAMLEAKLAQTRELKESRRLPAYDAGVTCPCGLPRTVMNAYRCLYCEIYYCKRCAEIHFGQSVADYKKEHWASPPNAYWIAKCRIARRMPAV